jgi:hypothetical protein
MPFLHLALYEPPRVQLDMRAATFSRSFCRQLKTPLGGFLSTRAAHPPVELDVRATTLTSLVCR